MNPKRPPKRHSIFEKNSDPAFANFRLKCNFSAPNPAISAGIGHLIAAKKADQPTGIRFQNQHPNKTKPTKTTIFQPMSPLEIFEKMMSKDALSKAMGMELIEVGEGFCTLKMAVKSWMLNGFGVTHGGITFCLADSAFAFACNSHGRLSVSIECSISHVAPVFENDVLTAVCREQFLGKRTSNYSVEIKNQDSKTVALFKSTAFRKDKIWSDDAP